MQHLPTNALLQGGKYKIERVLGQGGFGITYLATQVGLNRKVAIKEFFMREYCNRDTNTSHVTVGSEGSRDVVGKFRSKFVKEAQNIACLKHPYIISIYDVFEENGTAYYVMEYLDRGSLAELVKQRGRLSEADALRYIRQIADALRYIHARNMNHLDVKPGNILIDETNGAVLIDFGLSKRYDDEGNQTSTTPVGISHGYAPLEQYKKGGVGTFSPATDIYSLGATLHKLITGITPPDANDILTDGLPSHPNMMSASVYAAIEQAMQPNRNKRPQSIEEFLGLLAATGSATVEEQEDETTQLDESLRASLVTPSASQSSARPSINRGTVGGASSHPEENHEQVGGNPKRSAEQTPFSFKKLLIPLLACVVAVVAFFGVRAYNNISAENARLAEETRLAAIEQRRIDSIAKVKETARLEQHYRDSIAKAEEAQRIAEEKRKEEERLKAEEAKRLEQQRAEEERIAKQKRDYERGFINGHQFVDLGLSVKWATCNVGASSPSGYGNYYAWGETSTKIEYTVETYKHYRNGKYVNIGSNISGTKYDAARVNWGATWRMPTLEEIKELKEKCTWAWTTLNGINGYRVTGPNGKNIFLPPAGDRGSTYLGEAGTFGNYWSATPGGDNCLAHGLLFHSHYYDWGRDSRHYGRTVRPVSE